MVARPRVHSVSSASSRTVTMQQAIADAHGSLPLMVYTRTAVSSAMSFDCSVYLSTPQHCYPPELDTTVRMVATSRELSLHMDACIADTGLPFFSCSCGPSSCPLMFSFALLLLACATLLRSLFVPPSFCQTVQCSVKRDPHPDVSFPVPHTSLLTALSLLCRTFDVFGTRCSLPTLMSCSSGLRLLLCHPSCE